MTGITFYRICTVASRIDTDIGTNETIIANSDRGFIEDSEVEISKEPLADADLLAIVTTEWLIDDNVVIAYLSE